MALLKDIHYRQLDVAVWCATAYIVHTQSKDQLLNNKMRGIDYGKTKRQIQREGVRSLLQNLLVHLNITDSLDDSMFPYRLNLNHYYVCFSHSKDKVAVVISAKKTAGIDIEINNISWQVARRFYHSDEIEMLGTLSDVQYRQASKSLWQLKESFIKIENSSLAKGLGVSYSYLIPQLIDALTDRSRQSVRFIETNILNYKVALLTSEETLIVF